MSELGSIKPSDVQRPLFDTPWQNSERETIATNILKLARFSKKDCWESFTWEDYEKFCSHHVSNMEHMILDEFVGKGYLSKNTEGVYNFTNKIIGVYMMYCD
ncbi:MAG: hypothetical protein Q8L10_04840 [Candidatus Moranbacteria bacterium]|nr:hypothetical protein [Candidatus Moranbacteria bacterium]